MNNSMSNLKKLNRNLDNIIKNYIKIDDELLSALSEEDMDKFIDIIGSKSDDNFLESIVDEINYDSFTTNLFERLKEIHEDKIIMMVEEQKKVREFQMMQGKRVTRKQKKTKKLISKKGNRLTWNQKEVNLVKRLLKTNTKSGDIIKKLNSKRNENGMVSRTNSSIYGKIHRIKKEDEKGEDK